MTLTGAVSALIALAVVAATVFLAREAVVAWRSLNEMISVGKLSSRDEQLNRWVAGESVHNEERDECCPDFSCCKPELLAPREEREKFAGASEDVRATMLSTFLGRMFRAAGTEVLYFAGDPANYQPQQ